MKLSLEEASALARPNRLSQVEKDSGTPGAPAAFRGKLKIVPPGLSKNERGRKHLGSGKLSALESG